eukprot:2026246-Pyramimonas_sp.AAC.1
MRKPTVDGGSWKISRAVSRLLGSVSGFGGPAWPPFWSVLGLFVEAPQGHPAGLEGRRNAGQGRPRGAR